MERLDKSRDVAVDRAEIDALTITSTLGGADHARRPRYASLMNGTVLDNSELGYHGEHEKVTDKSG